MKAFIWLSLFWVSISLVAKTSWMGNPASIPQRTPKTLAFDVVTDVALLVWIVVLLARGE